MRKSELIRLVDSILFANLQRKILEIYERARVINGGGAFKYHFFADPSAKYHFLRPPSEETISFLFQHVRELQPAIENRQAINYLVIRFLNEARQPYAVLKLLPLSVLSTDIKDVLRDLILSDSDENLLKVFIESPEYNLLKRQVVFNTME